MKTTTLALFLSAFAGTSALAQTVTYEGKISPGAFLETPGKTFPDFEVSMRFDFVHSVRAKAEAYGNRYWDDDNGTWQEFCVTRMILPSLGTMTGTMTNLGNGLKTDYSTSVALYYLDGEGEGTGADNCRTKPLVTGPRKITVDASLGRFRTGDNYVEVAIANGIPADSFTLNALGNDEYELVYKDASLPQSTEVEYSVSDMAFQGHGLNSKTGRAILQAR